MLQRQEKIKIAKVETSKTFLFNDGFVFKKNAYTHKGELKVHTSQAPRGSPLAASNPADIMVKSGAKAEAAEYDLIL